MTNTITFFSKESCERNIKFDRKFVRSQCAWLIFNLSITFFDLQVLMNHPNPFSGVAFGAMLITSLWSLLFLIESWIELRSKKHQLKFLTELYETQLASMEREHYLEARQQYEQIIENFKEKHNDKGN